MKKKLAVIILCFLLVLLSYFLFIYEPYKSYRAVYDYSCLMDMNTQSYNKEKLIKLSKSYKSDTDTYYFEPPEHDIKNNRINFEKGIYKGDDFEECDISVILHEEYNMNNIYKNLCKNYVDKNIYNIYESYYDYKLNPQNINITKGKDVIIVTYDMYMHKYPLIHFRGTEISNEDSYCQAILVISNKLNIIFEADSSKPEFKHMDKILKDLSAVIKEIDKGNI